MDTDDFNDISLLFGSLNLIRKSDTTISVVQILMLKGKQNNHQLKIT